MRRILIADEHAVVRHGYRQFFEAENEPVEIGEAASGGEILGKLRAEPWDLLILNIHLPGPEGTAQLSEIASSFPLLRILVISALPEKLHARNAIRAGAHGFLSKESDAKELMKAVRTVLAGNHYVSAELVQLMAEDIDVDLTKPLHEALSAREFQVFRKLAAGWGVTMIARDLALSVKTVSTYRTRILEKMRFTSNADITAYAIRHAISDDAQAALHT